MMLTEMWGMYDVYFILVESNVKAGETVDTGYSNDFKTAPNEAGTYNLYQAVYAEGQPITGHAGWKWVKTK